MSHLANVLRQITKKASHPNSLIHGVQLERARQKYIVRGELIDGKEDAVALGAPKEERQERVEEKGSKPEAAGPEEEGGEGRAEAETGQGDGEDAGQSASGKR